MTHHFIFEVVCQVNQFFSDAMFQNSIEFQDIKVEDLGLGSNPTPAMIAQKRRSLASKSVTTPVRKAPPAKVAAAVALPSQSAVKAAAAPKVEPKAEPKAQPILEPAISTLLSPTQGGRRLSRPKADPTPTKPVPEPTKKSPAAAKAGKGKSVAATLAAPSAGFPGAEDSKIYLAQGKILQVG